MRAASRLSAARRLGLVGLLLWVGRLEADHRPIVQVPLRVEPDPRGRDLVQRSTRTHGGVRLWDSIRDLYLEVERSIFDERGRVARVEREGQWIIKGRRPSVRLERPGPEGLLVLGLDGHRAWATRDGVRLRTERVMAEAEEDTRWAAFVARLPFILGEDDSRSIYRGTGRVQRSPTVVVDVAWLGGTRPSEERVFAHLDAHHYRLRAIDFDHAREPGSRYRMEMEKYSTHRGVMFPMRRTTRRSDGRLVHREEVLGIRLDQAPPLHLFAPPEERDRPPPIRRAPPVGEAGEEEPSEVARGSKKDCPPAPERCRR